jgi:hypothetical protein
MANALQNAGALSEPTSFAPLHTNRIFTGLWTNRSPLRDAATSDYQEHYGMGRQDSIWDGFNSEVSPKLTLKRRAGLSFYNGANFPPVSRFYSFNTFTLTTETIRVLADTQTAVFDVTTGQGSIVWPKPNGAGKTYFLGVGNTLYFTNGLENKQWNYATSTVTDWGVNAPANAPQVSQQAITNTYGKWLPNTAMGAYFAGMVLIYDPTSNTMQFASQNGVTGANKPPAFGSSFGSVTPDNTTTWFCCGAPADWQPNRYYNTEDAVHANVAVTSGQQAMMYVLYTAGTSGANPPAWLSAVGSFVTDGTAVWINVGVQHEWKDIGPGITIQTGSNNPVNAGYQILDPNGYVQTVLQSGVTGPTPPNFSTANGALTLDGSVIWGNTLAYAVAATAPRQYGYAFLDSSVVDISNMSPKSAAISVIADNQVVVQGEGPPKANYDTIILYRTAAGGSTFFELARFAATLNTAWTFIDVGYPDSALNTELQAQVNGEGTPLPVGATCLGYHLGRIFAAVGNVVYVSSGPDAVASGSSGNAGFDTTFTAQSKITRFWVCSLGMVVFTVRDAYIILGSGTDADPLYMVVFIDNLPLLSYDCFTLNRTTPYLLLGNNQLVSLDPSAGITELGFPIADKLEEEFNPAASFVTFHTESSRESALYVANGVDHWYRMAANNAPEQGSSWSPRANIAGMGCVQSVEVSPGQYRLLISKTITGPVLQRDRKMNTDAGVAFAVDTVLGSIVLAQPGQLSAMSFITLESMPYGSKPGLGVLLGEISPPLAGVISPLFDTLFRTRQDPPNLPPSTTLYSDRYHFMQNQNEVWCRHFQMQLSWPAEDAANELLTFTIFGQTWQEMRSQ